MRRANTRAFTLIEVLVALAIVSIGMLAVIQAVGQTVGNSAYLRDKTLAHWVAMNQLTLMRLNPTLPTKGMSNGEMEMGGRNWRWSAEVVQTAVDSVLRIDIGVRLADGDENSQLASITGFVGAKIAKPGVLVTQFTAPVSATGTITSTTPPPTLSPPTPVPSPSIPTPGNLDKTPIQQPLIR